MCLLAAPHTVVPNGNHDRAILQSAASLLMMLLWNPAGQLRTHAPPKSRRAKQTACTHRWRQGQSFKMHCARMTRQEGLVPTKNNPRQTLHDERVFPNSGPDPAKLDQNQNGGFHQTHAIVKRHVTPQFLFILSVLTLQGFP